MKTRRTPHQLLSCNLPWSRQSTIMEDAFWDLRRLSFMWKRSLTRLFNVTSIRFTWLAPVVLSSLLPWFTKRSRGENSKLVFVYCSRLSIKTSLSLIHVLGLSQLLNNRKDSFKWHTCRQSHTTIQFVRFFLYKALVKVPGWESGFMASDAVRAARNVNICLVPEFPFCFYGSGGLLRYIGDRIKYRGSCVIVYA